MIRRCLFSVLIAACGDDGGSTDASTNAELTLANCSTSIGATVPEPYRSLFHCVEMTVEGYSLGKHRHRVSQSRTTAS